MEPLLCACKKYEQLKVFSQKRNLDIETAFAEDVQKAKDAGMNAHVSKPIDPNMLKKTLLDVLRRSGASAAATSN